MEKRLISALGITDRFLRGVKNNDSLRDHLGCACMLAKAEQDPQFTEEIMEVIKKWLLEPFSEE